MPATPIRSMRRPSSSTPVNFLMQSPYWATTAVVINYDDSDGWYDHQLGQIMNTSQTSADGLTGTGLCGTVAPRLPESALLMRRDVAAMDRACP